MPALTTVKTDSTPPTWAARRNTSNIRGPALRRIPSCVGMKTAGTPLSGHLGYRIGNLALLFTANETNNDITKLNGKVEGSGLAKNCFISRGRRVTRNPRLISKLLKGCQNGITISLVTRSRRKLPNQLEGNRYICTLAWAFLKGVQLFSQFSHLLGQLKIANRKKKERSNKQVATKITHEKRENKRVPLAADTENNNTEEERWNIILSRSRFSEDETRNKNKNS